MMKRFWTIGFLQILKGLEAEGHPGLRGSSGEEEGCGGAPHLRYEDMPKDIHTQMAQYFGLGGSGDYRLPFGNR